MFISKTIAQILYMFPLQFIPYAVTGLLLYRLLCCMVPKKEGKIWSALIFISCAIISNIIIFAGDLFNVTMVLLWFIVLMLSCFKGRLSARLAIVSLLYPLIIAQNFLVMEVLGKLYFASGKAPWMDFLVSLLDPLLHILIWYLLLKVFRKKLKQVPLLFDDKTWALLGSVCFASLVGITSSIYFAPQETWKMWPNAAACFLTNISCLYLAEYFSNSIRHEMERQNLKLQKEYYEELEHNQDQIRKFRHDMRNHLAVIISLFDSGDRTEAEAYFREVDAQMTTANRVFCKNSIVNAVLNAKYNQAAEYNIDCFFNIDLKNLFSIDPVSLCSLFANTLDNALEASLKIKDPACRKISVKARVTENGYFSYEIKNRKTNPIAEHRGKFLSDKKTSGPHGLGLSNVREIVEKYEGTLDISYTDDTFCVTVLIGNVI